MTEPRIRAATVHDARAIAEVQVATWRVAYRGIVDDAYLDGLRVEAREPRWREQLGGTSVFVTESPDGRVTGFVSGGPNRRPDEPFDAELYALYVLPAFQGTGAGRALVRALADALLRRGYRSMAVSVLAGNPSRRFYERLGGEPAGEHTVELGGTPYLEARYGWPDLRALVAG